MPTPPNPGKPNSRAHRRPTPESGQRARGVLVDLPAEGCTLPVPRLPSGRSWSRAERARWRELWQSPQATQWDDAARGTVAVLVAYESQLLAGAGSAWMAAEYRHAADALGLSPRAMVALGWRLAES